MSQAAEWAKRDAAERQARHSGNVKALVCIIAVLMFLGAGSCIVCGISVEPDPPAKSKPAAPAAPRKR